MPKSFIKQPSGCWWAAQLLETATPNRCCWEVNAHRYSQHIVRSRKLLTQRQHVAVLLKRKYADTGLGTNCRYVDFVCIFPPCCSGNQPSWHSWASACFPSSCFKWAAASIQREGGSSSTSDCREQTALCNWCKPSSQCQANRSRRVAQNKQKQLNTAAWREQVQWNHFRQEYFTSEPLKNEWKKKKVA